MEKLEIISIVNKPSGWCAGIVIVPKIKLSICVDLTKLNEIVCREHHILPSVKQTLDQLGELKLFSKLDANS